MQSLIRELLDHQAEKAGSEDVLSAVLQDISADQYAASPTLTGYSPRSSVSSPRRGWS